MSFTRILARIFKKPASGGTWSRELEHPYFGRMTYFQFRSAAPYWEAEIPIPNSSGKASIQLAGAHDGPTEAEEQFCRRVLADLDALFERCREAFGQYFDEWASRPMPERWRDAFEFDGLSVPAGGDENDEWEVTYFVNAANHWFTAVFEHGRVADVRIDG